MGITERKKRERERRHNDIVDAAEKVFFSKGFDNATIDEIAKKAELSKGTIYLYFKSREEIHYAILLRALSYLNKNIRKEYDEKASFRDNLHNIAKSYVDFMKKQKNYFKAIMYFDSSKTDKIREEQFTEILKDDSPLIFIIEILQKNQELGIVRNDINPAELAILLWSQVTGVLETIEFKGKLFDIVDINPEKFIINQFNIILDGVIKK